MPLDPSTRISRNFQLWEFMTPNVPEDYPGAWAPTKLAELGQILQWVRDLAGVPGRVTSAYRTPARNAAIHGADDSQHMDGDAADVVFVLVPVRTLAARVLAAIDTAPAFGQVILYGDTGHVHVSNPAARLGDRNGQLLFSPGVDATGVRRYEPLDVALVAGDVPLLSPQQTMSAAAILVCVLLLMLVFSLGH